MTEASASGYAQVMSDALSDQTVPPLPVEVSAVFGAYPRAERHLAEDLRARVFDIAARTRGVGRLTETLKWGQPAYLTEETGAGTTLRIARAKTGGVGLYVPCQSRVVSDLRLVYDAGLVWDGTRGVILSANAPLPEAAVGAMILAALTYRL